MINLKGLKDMFDRVMAAITFAEAGERETALDMLYDKPEKTKQKRIGSRITDREENRPSLRV